MLSLAQGLWAAGQFNPHLQRIRPESTNDRRLRRGVRRLLQTKTGRQAFHGGGRWQPNSRLSLRYRCCRGIPTGGRNGKGWRNLESGAGNPQSVNRLVELLGGEKVYIPKRPGEPDCTWADIGKIKRDLKWRPRVSFEEGVACMLKDIEAWRDAPLWDPQSIAEATKTWFQYLGSG